MLKFSLWLLGALIIAGTCLALAVLTALPGGASFVIGWAACGIYSVVMFCGIDGEPENVDGTSIVMILGGALTLLFVLCMTAEFEIWFRPKHKLIFDSRGRSYYVPKN